MTNTEHSSAHALDERVPGARIATSRGRAWKDLLVQVYERHPHQECLLIPAVPEPLVVWVLSGAAVVEEREMGGAWQAHRVSEGDFFLTNASDPYELRWTAENAAPFEVMHLYLGLPLLKRVISEVVGDNAKLELVDVSGGRDPVLSALLEPLRSELMSASAPSALFVQGLAQSLAVHLVRRYGVASTGGQRPRGGVARVQTAARDRADGVPAGP